MCPICLEEGEEPGLLYKRLPCRHVFHAQCLMSWFSTQLRSNVQGQMTCPHCRAVVPNP